MISSATVFLWLVVCLDGPACQEWDAYQLDHFPASASAEADCDSKAEARALEYEQAPDLPEWRLTCSTEADFRRAYPAQGPQLAMRL